MGKLLLPVVALHQQHEIVATNMANKIQSWVANAAEDAAQQLDQLVALAIAVVIVVGFEVIKVAIAGDKAAAVADQPIDVFIDRHVAR